MQLKIAAPFIALLVCSGGAVAADSPCASGWFAAKAQVVRIDPADKSARRRSPNGAETDVEADAILCAGDTLLAPPGVRSVEYFEGGRTFQIGERQAHRIESAPGRVSDRALEYVRLALNSVSVLAAPTARPAPTSSRGGGGVASATIAALHEIRPLRGLPRQKVVDGLAIIVSWRDGASPYSCQVVGDTAETLWTGHATESSWCIFTSEPVPAAARFLVRDAGRRSVGWNISRISWAAVPRPEWIAPAASQTLASPEMAAWSIWLWRSGEPEWRLQALAMLNAASSELIAAQLLESVIAEAPLYPTN